MIRVAIMHTHTRQYYLSDIPLSEALQKFHDALAEAGALILAEAETLGLDQAHALPRHRSGPHAPRLTTTRRRWMVWCAGA